MPVRYLKMVFVFFEALLCLFYATQNMANLHAAYGAVAYTTTMQGHALYPHAFGPGYGAPFLVGLTLAVIIFFEYLAGLLSAKGLWDLWKNRTAPVDVFNKAKGFALFGAGTAIFVWFGLFSVVGGAYFQMWQTQPGWTSLQGAFTYAVFSAIVLFFVNMKDD
ncbi:MAG: DUF2165 family protein [Gammaproteobacteria bacterium]